MEEKNKCILCVGWTAENVVVLLSGRRLVKLSQIETMKDAVPGPMEKLKTNKVTLFAWHALKGSQI